MREYHEVKGTTTSLDFFKNPELAARVTLDAQRILGVDAAIMFADLLPVLEPMGMQLSYEAGEGPVFANPVRSAEGRFAARDRSGRRRHAVHRRNRASGSCTICRRRRR